MTEAKKQANKIINEVNRNVYFNDSKMLFYDLALKWYENYYIPNFTPEVVRNAKLALNSRILPYLADYKLCNLTPSVLNAYVNELKSVVSEATQKKLAPATIRKIFNYVSSILNYAVRMEIIEYNPCTKVKLRFTNEEKEKTLHFYTPEQCKELFKAMENEPVTTQLPIMIAVYCGLRRSEIYGLKWSDVDLENKTIHIQRARLKTANVTNVTKTKSRSSNRVIVINDDIINLLSQLDKSKEFVFANADRNIVEKLHRIQDKAKLPRIKFHDLRHTCATLLLSNGIDVKSVSEFLGHSNISTTSLYVHAIDSKFKKESETLTSILK